LRPPRALAGRAQVFKPSPFSPSCDWSLKNNRDSHQPPAALGNLTPSRQAAEAQRLEGFLGDFAALRLRVEPASSPFLLLWPLRGADTRSVSIRKELHHSAQNGVSILPCVC